MSYQDDQEWCAGCQGFVLKTDGRCDAYGSVFYCKWCWAKYEACRQPVANTSACSASLPATKRTAGDSSGAGGRPQRLSSSSASLSASIGTTGDSSGTVKSKRGQGPNGQFHGQSTLSANASKAPVGSASFPASKGTADDSSGAANSKRRGAGGKFQRRSTEGVPEKDLKRRFTRTWDKMSEHAKFLCEKAKDQIVLMRVAANGDVRYVRYHCLRHSRWLYAYMCSILFSSANVGLSVCT